MSDLISRQDIKYHTQLEAMGNGQYEEVEVAYKNDIESLPSADTDMSDYCDRLWKIAYERGKADGPTGEWQGYNADNPDWTRKDGTPIFMVCDQCHGTVLNNGSTHWHYCPNCGARMDGEDK